MKIYIYIIIYILFFYNTAVSAPSISSVSYSGDTVVIVGTGFGTHADYGGIEYTYLPYLFENCEAGVVNLADRPWSGWASMTTNNNRLNSFYNAYHERYTTPITYTNIFGNSVNNAVRSNLVVDVTDDAPVHNYFVSQWIMLSSDFSNITGGGSNQVKLIMTTPYDEVGGKDYFSTAGWDDPPKIFTVTESGQTSPNFGTIQTYMPYGTWHRMDLWVSVPDETTGDVDVIKYYIDGKLINTMTQLGYTQTEVHKVGHISFVGYIFNGSDSSFSVQTDDHFVDFTMSRVEMSENSTWDENTQYHKEIQIPTAWSTTEITATVNQGSFANGSSVYVFVVDSNGDASAGYGPITIGASPTASGLVGSEVTFGASP